jgi:hypothetical protein
MLLGVNFEWLSTGRAERLPSNTHSAREIATDDWIRPEERRLLSTFSDLKPKQRAALLGFLDDSGFVDAGTLAGQQEYTELFSPPDCF